MKPGSESRHERVVVITGASRGIGRVIAVDLARDGGRLVLAARDEAGLKGTAALVESAGARATIVSCDVSLAGARFNPTGPPSKMGPTEWRNGVEP